MRNRSRRRLTLWHLAACAILAFAAIGCVAPRYTGPGPLVLFLDGAGWSGSDGGVRRGLQDAGFRGHVEAFGWSSMLGPVPDHFLVDRKKRKAEELAERIVEYRRIQPRAEVHLTGLSAGTAVVVFALERLPAGFQVDNVALFAPSFSDDYDLSAAMEHVGGCLYLTSSVHDGILAGVRLNADGGTGRPAGIYGARIPTRVKGYHHYARIVNLPWRPAYSDLGWSGSHTGATGREFVHNVVAPRVMTRGPQPLNRPLAPTWIAEWRDRSVVVTPR